MHSSVQQVCSPSVVTPWEFICNLIFDIYSFLFSVYFSLYITLFIENINILLCATDTLSPHCQPQGVLFRLSLAACLPGCYINHLAHFAPLLFAQYVHSGVCMCGNSAMQCSMFYCSELYTSYCGISFTAQCTAM